jgi:hypothetical protein
MFAEAERYGGCARLTDPTQPRYAEHRGVERQNGQRGKPLWRFRLFQAPR